MTLRELIETMPGDEYLTLIIKNRYYSMKANYVNILRQETLDLVVVNVIGGRCDGEPSLTVTLKVPEVPADERPRDDNSVGIVYGRRN